MTTFTLHGFNADGSDTILTLSSAPLPQDVLQNLGVATPLIPTALDGTPIAITSDATLTDSGPIPAELLAALHQGLLALSTTELTPEMLSKVVSGFTLTGMGPLSPEALAHVLLSALTPVDGINPISIGDISAGNVIATPITPEQLTALLQHSADGPTLADIVSHPLPADWSLPEGGEVHIIGVQSHFTAAAM